MAIQIIRQGTDPNYKYCGLCHTCGSILEYEFADLEQQISAWHELHIICPTCGRPLAFNSVPITEEEVEINESLLCVFPDVTEVPSGVESYILTKQGNEIHLKQVTDFIPENTSVLLIGNSATFRYFRGISLEKPINMLQLAKAEFEETTCYYIDANKQLIKTVMPKGSLIISTNEATDLTTIVLDQ